MTFRRGGQTQVIPHESSDNLGPTMRGGINKYNPSILSADRSKYSNLQLDKYSLRIGGHFTTDAQNQYDEQVRAEKSAAKQALEKQLGINKTDLDKPNWWSTAQDPLFPNGAPIPKILGEVWNSNNLESVDARWFWDTQRYTKDEADHYEFQVSNAATLVEHNKENDEFYGMPINERDKLYNEGKLTTYQSDLWKFEWNKAGVKAKDEIDNKQYVTREELDTTKWSTEPNETDASQIGWENPVGRAFWDTGRFTFQQALIYLALSNDAQKNPEKPSVDCIHFIKDIDWISPSSIVDGVSNFALCEVGKLETAIVTVKDDIIQTVKDLINPYMTTLEIIIFLLLSGGVVAGLIAYKSGALGFAARTGVAATKFVGESAIVLAGGGPILGGVQYLGNKMVEAKQKNTSVGNVIASDLSLAAVNPTGFAAKVIGEQINK